MTRKLIAVFVIMISTTGCHTSDSADADQRLAIDLIIEGDHVLTMAGPSIENGAVAIDDGEILAVAGADEINDRFRADETLPGAGRIVMPGLVNGHTHAAMSLLRGIADDLELMQWLNEFIFPAEVRFVDEEFVAVGTRLACWEMIRGGTTSFVDMYYFPDAVAETVVDCGLRAVVVPSVIEQKSPDAQNGDQSLTQAEDFARRWRDKHPRIIPAIGAHSVYTISEAGLARIQSSAATLGVPVSIHVSESRAEIDATRAQYERTPVELLHSLGYFNGPLIAAHMVYPTSDDIALLAKKRVGVVHNPTSNMKLASGVSPVDSMLDAGVLVGLGTDGAASNNDLDMWEEIRLASFLAKVTSDDPTALPAATVLEMATIGGARAIGLADSVGSLEPGKRADLIQIDTSSLSQAPVYRPLSHLAYVADEHDVVTTVVDGQVLMRDRQVLTIDADVLRDDVDRISRRIADALVN
ncbi:MAG: amidohydrolase family protein [Pseudomonadota bacterium]